MFSGLRGINHYHKDFKHRLPLLSFRGLSTDLRMHFNIKSSQCKHVFVIGAPRSGTTLIRGVMAAHSKVATTDEETYFFCRRRVSRFNMVELAPVKQKILDSPNKVAAFDVIADWIKRRDGGLIFLEKTPEHALFIDNLIDWFPHSKFVWVLRDGRDAYASAFRNPGLNRAGNRYPYVWRDIARKAIKYRGHPSINFIHYESFTANPGLSARNAMKWLGLEFESQQLDIGFYSKTSMAESKGHEKLKTAITPASVGRYRERLTEEDILYFEKIAGKELTLLGYV